MSLSLGKMVLCFSIVADKSYASRLESLLRLLSPHILCAKPILDLYSVMPYCVHTPWWMVGLGLNKRPLGDPRCGWNRPVSNCLLSNGMKHVIYMALSWIPEILFFFLPFLKKKISMFCLHLAYSMYLVDRGMWAWKDEQQTKKKRGGTKGIKVETTSESCYISPSEIKCYIFSDINVCLMKATYIVIRDMSVNSVHQVSDLEIQWYIYLILLCWRKQDDKTKL